MSGVRFDVVGLGIAASDYLVGIDRFPGPDEKVRAPDLVIAGGGTVGNTLSAITRLGRTAAFAGAVGDDDFGRTILGSLAREGVDLSLVRHHPGARSPFSFCVAAPPSRNVFSVRPTTPPLTRADLPEGCFATRYLHTDGSDELVAAEVAREARERGVVVSVDLQRIRPGAAELLDCAHIAVVSAAFARELLGDLAPDRQVRELFRHGMLLAGVTCGERGMWAMEPGGAPCHVPAEPVAVVDSTGAGDAFHGALLVGLLEGMTARQALGLASHVAARSVTAIGGRAGVPHRADVALLRDRIT